MSIIFNIYYKGSNGSAKKFAEEMISSGIVDKIRKEEGNERYDYFISFENTETVLLIDKWKDQKSLDEHHSSPIMEEIIKLREKYDLHMKVDRFAELDDENNQKFIRK